MATNRMKRAALYVRVCRDGQTNDNQRLLLLTVAERRGWNVVKVYEDAGIRRGKGRDKRPSLEAAMNDAVRRRFDVLAVSSVDRLGLSTATIATALAELDAAGVAIYAEREGMDTTTPHGQTMLQMAVVFAELERSLMRDRLISGRARTRARGKQLERPTVGIDVEDAIRDGLEGGRGMLKEDGGGGRVNTEFGLRQFGV
jgi:DNA invertase Pin-like site-specific DNA recombinase